MMNVQQPDSFGVESGGVTQYNRVEIYGVNTAKLKVLTEAEKQILLQKIKRGTPAEKKRVREEMISGNLKLVLSVIQCFTN